ncbi:transposase [Okeania sp. SIO1I7]|uniref:transposase n=1 Tax=Okeania sp. SIO1I7 TaxID=2607772 RepID=UPI0035C93701
MLKPLYINTFIINQQALCRKTKGSNNYHKARLKVARIHAKIKDSRLDYTHKLTTQLIYISKNSQALTVTIF